jgi:hypothetical protein
MKQIVIKIDFKDETKDEEMFDVGAEIFERLSEMNPSLIENKKSPINKIRFFIEHETKR